MRQQKPPVFSRPALLLSLFALLLLPHVAAAQTVMVYVSGEGHFDPYLFSAVEAGVMDAFFDAGIIVFNAGTYERVSDSDMQRQYWVRNTARQGGATHTVEVDVELAVRPGEGPRFGGATFRLVRVEPASVLVGGRVLASEVDAAPNTAADQIGFRIGTEIARSALSRM